MDGIKEFLKVTLVVLFGGVGVILLLTIIPVLTMWLWNWIIPGITGWSEISFWQAVGLCFLGRWISGGGGSCNCNK